MGLKTLTTIHCEIKTRAKSEECVKSGDPYEKIFKTWKEKL